jgi:hypothetical protein
MDIEVLWYEFSPFIYIAIGVASVIFSPSQLTVLCCGLLLIASSSIIRMRWVHRRKLDTQGRYKA